MKAAAFCCLIFLQKRCKVLGACEAFCLGVRHGQVSHTRHLGRHCWPGWGQLGGRDERWNRSRTASLTLCQTELTSDQMIGESSSQASESMLSWLNRFGNQ